MVQHYENTHRYYSDGHSKDCGIEETYKKLPNTPLDHELPNIVDSRDQNECIEEYSNYVDNIICYNLVMTESFVVVVFHYFIYN